MKAVLKIIKQDWTGWTPKQPQPNEFNIEVNKGDLLDIVKEGRGNPSAVLKEVNSDSVVISTSKLSPRSGDLIGDYSNLETVIKKGESVKFFTQMTDAGSSFTITLKDIKP